LNGLAGKSNPHTFRSCFYCLPAGSGKPIEGGLPFLPESANSMIGMIAFSAGAIFTGLLGIYAIYEFFKKRKSDTYC